MHRVILVTRRRRLAHEDRRLGAQAVRDYLKNNPKATSGEIAAALNKQGIKIKPSHVANIKSQSKKRRAKKVKPAAAEVAAPVAEEKPVKTGDMVTVEQVKKVAELIKTLFQNHD